MVSRWCLLLWLIADSTALRTVHPDTVVIKFDEERYQYMAGADGVVHLVDTWVKASDLAEVVSYNPDAQNVYHLYTRENPTVGQRLLMGQTDVLQASDYDPARRTIVIVHGWLDSVTGTLKNVLVPAFLEAEDVNVIFVDWSAGAGTLIYPCAVLKTPISGESVARFVNWVNKLMGSSPAQYHIVGHSLGGHQAGIIGRNVDENIAYITALDPAQPCWIFNRQKFRSTDGTYTEVIHTDVGVFGFPMPLGQVDFYPNGGRGMPGCGILGDHCNHSRCYHYLGESLTSVFTGKECTSFWAALIGKCSLGRTMPMGGLRPKTGATGVFYLQTNADSPYSRG